MQNNPYAQEPANSPEQYQEEQTIPFQPYPSPRDWLEFYWTWHHPYHHHDMDYVHPWHHHYHHCLDDYHHHHAWIYPWAYQQQYPWPNQPAWPQLQPQPEPQPPSQPYYFPMPGR